MWTFVISDATLRLAPSVSTPKKDEEEIAVEGPLLLRVVDSNVVVKDPAEEGKGKK